MNFFSILSARWTDNSKIAITSISGNTLTYGAVQQETAKLANALSTYGVSPGDRVAVQVEKSAEALLLYLACLRAGAVYLPLNTAYTTSELAYFLSDAEPAVFIARPDHAFAAEQLCKETRTPNYLTLGTESDGSLMDLAVQQTDDFPDVVRTKSDLASILYTSGTTGRSKGAMLSHENLASNAEALATAWRFSSHDVLLHALPIFHVHGLFVASNVTFCSNASMIFLPKFDTNDVFGQLPNATVMMGVPTFYVRLLNDDRLTREIVSHMRLFISGSAPLLAETHRAFEERTGHAILERYGMTETGMNTSNPYEGERLPGAVGSPLPGIDVRIAHPESGEQMPQGEVGMIEVKGPNVFQGYWRMAEKTASEFRPDGYFITGDLGKFDENGYLHIVGREKDLIISGGYNIYPKEIETEIDTFAGVIESAVVGVPHPDFGEGVIAIVVKSRESTLNEAEILSELKTRLAGFKLPKKIFFIDDLPRNTMGKVQKNSLRETYGSVFQKRG